MAEHSPGDADMKIWSDDETKDELYNIGQDYCCKKLNQNTDTHHEQSGHKLLQITGRKHQETLSLQFSLHVIEYTTCQDVERDECYYRKEHANTYLVLMTSQFYIG